MSYYERDYETEERIAEAGSYLRRNGYVKDEFGDYYDPHNVTRSKVYIDKTTGRTYSDM